MCKKYNRKPIPHACALALKFFRSSLTELVYNPNNHLTLDAMCFDLNIDKSTLYSWMKGEHIPRPRNIRKICGYFNTNPFELFKVDTFNKNVEAPILSEFFKLEIDEIEHSNMHYDYMPLTNQSLYFKEEVTS